MQPPFSAQPPSVPELPRSPALPSPTTSRTPSLQSTRETRVGSPARLRRCCSPHHRARHCCAHFNYSASNPGQALILTATVTPNAIPATIGEQNPTGNIIFYDGTTVIGTSALTASIGDSSIATFTTQSLPGGQDVLSAYYVGDFSFDPETSNLLTLDILNFTVSPSPSDPSTNLNIVQGASGSASFLISGQGGFSSAVQVVCAVPTQDNMTCTASPQDVNPPTTVTFVIQTFLPGQQTTTTAARSNHLPRLWTRVVSGTALAVLGVFLLPFGKRRRIFAERSSRSLWILLLLLVGLGASGVGCSSVAGVNGTGTPLGVATIKNHSLRQRR